MRKPYVRMAFIAIKNLVDREDISPIKAFRAIRDTCIITLDALEKERNGNRDNGGGVTGMEKE